MPRTEGQIANEGLREAVAFMGEAHTLDEFADRLAQAIDMASCFDEMASVLDEASTTLESLRR